MHKFLYYDVHGMLKMRIEDKAVATEIAREQWQYFQVPDCDAELTVTAHPTRLAGTETGAISADDAAFTDVAVYVPKLDLFVERVGEKLTFSSTRETGRLIAPWLDYMFVSKGNSLLHAAAVSYAGHAYLISGWGGVGKTASLAHLVSQPDFAFMADDWVFVEADATVRCLPKPMYIYSYHADLYPHLFSAAHKPVLPQPLSRPVAKLRRSVRPLFERFPKVEQVARKWSPEHLKVMPAQALPDARVTHKAPGKGLIFLQRGRVPAPQTQVVSGDELVDRMMGIMQKEFSISAREGLTIAAGTGLVSIGRWIGDKQRITASALSKLQCLILTVPVEFDSRQVGPAVAAAIGGLDRP